jgi:signal transduction histidine kinase
MAFRDPLHWMSLRYKLALMFVGVCLLAFGVGGYLVSASARGALEDEIRARLEFQARAYASALDGELRALGGRLEDFASDGYIRSHVAALEAGGGDEERLARELLRHLEVNKLPLIGAFDALRVIDPRGEVVIDTAPGRDHAGVGLDPGERTLCSALVAASGPDEAPRFVLSTPLRTIDGSARLGRLCADVRTGVWITDALRGESVGRAGTDAPVELRLVDGAGDVLKIAAERVALASGDSELARAGFGLTLAPKGSAAALRAGDDAGSFVRSFPISFNAWQAEVALRAESALAAVAGLQSRFLVVGAVLALAAAALLYFPLRFLTQSLGGLREAATRIQSGDFSSRVRVTTEDELGDLAQAFNLMAAAVEERTKKTENAAAALRAESDRLSAVIASMRDGLIVLDPDGRAVLHNRSAEPLLRLMGREGVATSHHRCNEQRTDGTACKACLFDAQAAPRSCVIEIEGGVYEVRSTRFASADGGRTGRVLVSRDVTDRVAQDEREIHHERLAVLGEVAAVMAHELNNPLAAISMFNQMLATEIDRASPLRENVEVIQRNVDSCKRAIRELLDYAGNASPEIGEVDVEAVLSDVVAFLRPMRQRANVEIATDLGAAGAHVRGDEVQLRQIFVNLVLNGMQACAGRPGRIVLKSSSDGDFVVVDVIDNGGGIPPELQARIFKPFFSTKPRGEGTGLGLSTARRIAEMHGGSIELASSGPGGSTFRVRLRRSRGAAA